MIMQAIKLMSMAIARVYPKRRVTRRDASAKDKNPTIVVTVETKIASPVPVSE